MSREKSLLQGEIKNLPTCLLKCLSSKPVMKSLLVDKKLNNLKFP